jgi:hypothetical protein
VPENSLLGQVNGWVRNPACSLLLGAAFSLFEGEAARVFDGASNAHRAQRALQKANSNTGNFFVSQ